MFYIVESKDQLKKLLELRNEAAYVEVIPGNYNYHPNLTSTLAVFIYSMEVGQGYVLPISHPDGLGIERDIVKKVLSKFTELYVWDKKEFLYHFVLPNLTDIQLLVALEKYERIELPSSPKTFSFYYNKYSDHPEVNKMIPLTKLYEKCENNYMSLRPFMKFEKDESFNFYNNIATKVFYLIEQSGLQTIYQPFVDLFKPNNPDYNVSENIAFTYYNLYNSTTRPTNAFNSVNFAAIPHKDEYRKAIIPRNDKFVEFDFDGYHLRLLCNEIGYELTEESAHKQLARLYFGKDEITDEEYKEAKQMNFQAIYGKIPAKYKDLEVFQKVQNYIDYKWSEFQGIGYVRCPISGRKYSEELKDMNPQKLMNYIMQNLETSNNVLILKEVLKFLSDKYTSIALYTYDAILFDYDERDGEDLLNNLKNIMSSGNKFPVHYKLSNNLIL